MSSSPPRTHTVINVSNYCVGNVLEGSTHTEEGRGREGERESRAHRRWDPVTVEESTE